MIFFSLLKCVFLVSFVREKDTMEVANRANSNVIEVREGGKEMEHINEQMGFTQRCQSQKRNQIGEYTNFARNKIKQTQELFQMRKNLHLKQLSTNNGLWKSRPCAA